jgi:multisubunit Na+/H+ antiporter MnhB subunit
VRIRTIAGVAFIGLITLATIILSLFAMAADARSGNPDPWWAYALMLGLGVGLAGLLFLAARRGRKASQRAALRDAALVRRYDTGEE